MRLRVDRVQTLIASVTSRSPAGRLDSPNTVEYSAWFSQYPTITMTYQHLRWVPLVERADSFVYEHSEDQTLTPEELFLMM